MNANRSDTTASAPDPKSRQDWQALLERLRGEPGQSRRAHALEVGCALVAAFGDDAAQQDAANSGAASGGLRAFFLANEDTLKELGLSYSTLLNRIKAWQAWLWLDKGVRDQLSISALVELAAFQLAAERKAINAALLACSRRRNATQALKSKVKELVSGKRAEQSEEAGEGPGPQHIHPAIVAAKTARSKVRNLYGTQRLIGTMSKARRQELADIIESMKTTLSDFAAALADAGGQE